jgi:hypothetical protein
VTATPRRISDIKPLFTNLAQTSHYQVIFGGLPTALISYLSRRGVNSFFIAENAGLLCYSASLPTTSYNTKTVDGNFTGIQEKFAVARLYSEIGLDFYVDNNYYNLKFLEHWMEFIASGSHNPIDNPSAGFVSQGNANYFMRMQYPENYKCNSTKIIKFDRNYQAEIEYTFIGLWPVSMSAPTVSYVQSDVLKVSASFQYDRYIAGRALSVNTLNGDFNNIDPSAPPTQPANVEQQSLTPVRGNSGVVFRSSTQTQAEATVSNSFTDSQGRTIINGY